MQVPALFQPMNLGKGFGDFDFNFSESTDSIFNQPDVFDLPLPETVDSGLNLLLPINVAVVDTSGNVNDQFGKPIISSDAITNIALNNPGREAEAVAQTLKVSSPDWTKQFKTTDDLVKAAYTLYNTSKAVVQGKPIPQSLQNPYVYNPNDPNMIRRLPTSQTGLSTNMLLIGGVAFAAFLVLRKK